MGRIMWILLVGLLAGGTVTGPEGAGAAGLDIQEGGHICIVGGGVAERPVTGWHEDAVGRFRLGDAHGD